MNRKILITGTRGFLGSTLFVHSREQGYDPVPLEGDIRDRDAVERACDTHKPAWVIHTAAKIDIAECEKNPDEARAVNVEGTRNVTSAAERVSAGIVFISTTSVFSGMEGNYKEEDAPEPPNLYGKTKYEGEKIVNAYKKGTVVRLTLLGAHPDGSRGKNFLEWIIDSACQNKGLNLFNDQYVNQLSNWTTAVCIQKVMELKQQERIFHIGASEVLSKADVGSMILKRFPNYSGDLQIKSIDSLADGIVRAKQMWLNTDKANRLLMSMPTYAQELETIFARPPFKP